MKGIFITGTGTGVGKTIVSAALLRVLQSAGVDAVYMKPVQTGCRQKSGQLIAPDLEFVLSISGFCPASGERKLMAPYCFRKPCSPHLAARLEKRPIKLLRITSSFKALKHAHDFVIVEGAGGVLTPLSWQCSIIDLMQALALPVIVVARPGLGTINHTLLTLRELRRAKLNILGIVINDAGGTRKTVIEKDNLKTIERLGDTRIIAELPFMCELPMAMSVPLATGKYSAPPRNL